MPALVETPGVVDPHLVLETAGTGALPEEAVDLG
jgi:hypothetical protein